MIQLSDIIEYIKEYVINVSHDVEDLVVKNISTLDSSLPECMGWIATYKKEKQKLAEQSNVKYLITDTEVLITPKLFNKVIIHVSNPRLVFILIAERFFHPEETRLLGEASSADSEILFFRYWTMKEAFVKALGTGLSIPLND